MSSLHVTEHQRLASVTGTTAVRSVSANTTITTSDYLIRGTGGAGGITVTLPAATGSGRSYAVKKVDAGAGAVTVARAGLDAIDGQTSLVLSSQYDSVLVIDAASAVWDII